MDQFGIVAGIQLMSLNSGVTYDELRNFGLTRVVMNVVEICVFVDW
jgi:hypothetical protein